MAADRFPRRIGVGGGGDTRLALAVIAHADGLEDCRSADLNQRFIERAAVGDRGAGRSATSTPGDEAVFGEPMLRDLERGSDGTDCDMAGKEAYRVDGNILELDRHRVASGREGGEARLIVPRRLGVLGCDL